MFIDVLNKSSLAQGNITLVYVERDQTDTFCSGEKSHEKHIVYGAGLRIDFSSSKLFK